MSVEFHFNTKPQFVKRNNVTILGLYTEEKLARKMTKSYQVLRRPPGLTIDACAYDANVAGKDDWTIVFDISDSRRFWIPVTDFERYRKPIDRGQGQQYVIEFKYLHRDNELNDANITNPINPPDRPKTPQLAFNFGGL